MQRTYRASFLLTSIVLLGGLIGISAQAPAPATAAPAAAPVTRRVDYNWDVRPILSDYCFRCHGPDEKARQAGLRLDNAEGAYAALRRPGTFAIVPGRPAESQMIFRITHANAVVRMPPQVANKVLSQQQVEILRAWIAQGAQYKPHWAFTAPQNAAVPSVPSAPSVLNEIDRFVQARLAREGLTLSPPADKETLINRVTLTLTGLPPTLAEVDAFLKDASPRAVRKTGGSAAGLDGLRRARRRAVARHRALFGERRVPGRHARPVAVAVSRLGDRGAEQEHAVRPVCDVAAGGRPVAESHQGAAACHGVPARRQTIDRERRDRRGVPGRVCGRPCHDRGHWLSRHDGWLRALPRPQVRPDSDERLLLADRVLQQHRRARVLRAGPVGHDARPGDALGR